MCKFFSFIQSEKGFFYFNSEQRRVLTEKKHDSHSVIARFFLGNGAEDYCNKYEYTNGVLVVDQLNNKLLLKEDAEAFIKNLVASKEWEKICLAAVEQDGYALKYIKEQTEKICLAAAKRNGRALEYVNEQTEKICLAAVEQDGYALDYVNLEFKVICEAYIRERGG